MFALNVKERRQLGVGGNSRGGGVLIKFLYLNFHASYELIIIFVQILWNKHFLNIELFLFKGGEGKVYLVIYDCSKCPTP